MGSYIGSYWVRNILISPLPYGRATTFLDGYEKDCFILEREIESYWEIYIDSSITKAQHRNQRWDRTYLALILGSKPTWHRLTRAWSSGLETRECMGTHLDCI